MQRTETLVDVWSLNAATGGAVEYNAQPLLSLNTQRTVCIQSKLITVDAAGLQCSSLSSLCLVSFLVLRDSLDFN